MITTLIFIVAAGATYTVAQASIPPKFHKYDELIRKYSILHGVEYSLVKAHIMQESSFDERAKRDEGNGRVSIGLMQILYPNTATALQPGITIDELYNPETNIRLGCKLMAELKSRYSTLRERIVSYNSGGPKLTASGKYINEPYYNKVWYYYLIFHIGELL